MKTLISAVIAAFAWATLVFAAPVDVQAQDKVLKGRVTAIAAPGSPMFGMWQEMKEIIDQDPTIELEYFVQGELGSEEDSLAALRRNRIQLAGMTFLGMASLIPEVSVTMVPFFFESLDEADYIFDEHLSPILGELLAEKDLVPIVLVEGGWSVVYGKAPIRTLEDMQGVKLRTSPNTAHKFFLASLGADRVPLPASDIVQSLQTGLIAGGVTTTSFYTLALSDVAPNMTYSRHSYNAGAVIANGRWWRSASETQRQTMIDAYPGVVEGRVRVRDWVANLVADAQKDGLTIFELSDDERGRWVEASSKVAAEIIAETGGRSQEIYDAMVAGKQAYAARPVE